MKFGLTALLLLAVPLAFPLALPIHAQLPKAAHAVGETAGSYADPLTGNKVYRLSDPALCPSGAIHSYSYTIQFSRSGYMTFDCHQLDRGHTFPVYDKNFKLVSRDARKDAGIVCAGKTDAAQFSQVGDYLLAYCGLKVYRLDFLKHDNSLFADFALAHFPGAVNMLQGGPGPGDRLSWHLQDANYNAIAVATFDPSTRAYHSFAVPVPGDKAPVGFDEAQWSQNPNGRLVLVYGNAPNYSYSADLSSRVQFDDNHGHRGYFCGSNGRCYKVSPVNDNLPPPRTAGQPGCPGLAPWRTSFAFYDDVTGKRLRTWGCGPEGPVDSTHFSRSMVKDVFFGSGKKITRYTVSYDAEGNPREPKREDIAVTNTDPKTCGYWGQPRAASDWTGTRAMFDSTQAGGCRTDVYVVVAGSVPPPLPPPALGCSLNGNLLNCKLPSGKTFTLMLIEP